MACISKEQVQAKAIKLRQIAKQYGIKLSVSGSNSSTIKVTIQEGKIDFFWNLAQYVEDPYYVDREYIQVNHYYLDKSFSGVALECLEKIKEVQDKFAYDQMSQRKQELADIDANYKEAFQLAKKYGQDTTTLLANYNAERKAVNDEFDKEELEKQQQQQDAANFQSPLG